MSEDVSEPAAEDVAFIGGHLQRFLDGVGEAVACEAEVLEHYRNRSINSCYSLNRFVQLSFLAAKSKSNGQVYNNKMLGFNRIL